MITLEDIDGAPETGPERGLKAPGDQSADPAGAPPDSAPPGLPGGRRAGAPQGNGNALKHGLTAARDLRTRTDRRRETRDAMGILRAYGLEADPLARGIVRNLVRHETEARWAERYIQRRGRVDRNGEPKPVWRLYLEKISPQSDAWRRALDMLASKAPEPEPRALEYRARFSDSTDIPDIDSSPPTPAPDMATRSDAMAPDAGGDPQAVPAETVRTDRPAQPTRRRQYYFGE